MYPITFNRNVISRIQVPLSVLLTDWTKDLDIVQFR